MAKDRTAALGLQVSHEMPQLIAGPGEFKGWWEALKCFRRNASRVAARGGD